MKVLLSIKPKYAERIFNGTKKFEYRKTLFVKEDVTTVVVYVSSPVQQVVGEFDIDAIYSSHVDLLWLMTRHHAGITRKEYLEYFKNKPEAHAIKIGEVRRYYRPLLLSELNIQRAPQSFCYID